MTGDDGIESFGTVDRRRGADGALQLDDLAAIRQDLHKVLALLLTAANIVSADMGQRRGALHGPVDSHDWDVGVDDGLNRRGQSLRILRRDDYTVDTLGN